MARRLARITPEAAFWLKEEIAHIADKQPSAARNIAARISAAHRQLGDFPHSGQPGVIPGTRRWVVDPYIVTLRYKNGVVEIAAIRHAQQGDAYAPREALDKADKELVEFRRSCASERLCSCQTHSRG
ncbi:type II toxin-antitoxin system RelE/ParE family toxin [Methylopila sp. M107]|uniref:type II toxin-antitoxin system RelE/ParE family toxin n=1 Tax=Methylopila sp. M107 TaxID=1101190 RepID=UPI0009DBE065|nr:type II toxin-antitoxin system RelE/ParE family toxin [Methylopila sp. M107]